MTLYHRSADMLERYGRVDGVMHCEVSMLIAELRAAAALDELVRENERLGLYEQPSEPTVPKRDRKADRARFHDPAFNRWLDEGISDAGHTVWDQIESVVDAWHGWDNRQFYALDELVRENERLGLYDDQKPCWCHQCNPSTGLDRRMILCPICGNKRCPKANDHRNACSSNNEPGQPGSAYAAPAPAQPRQPVSEWIACSEQMPILSEGDDELPVYTWDGESVKADEFGFLFEQPAGPAVGGWVCIGADFLNNLSGTVTHWMPRNMPAAPERAITGDKP